MRECSTGGGAVIKGSKKASRGAKRRRISWQEEPEGGWRCAGVLGNFLNVKQDSRASPNIAWVRG